MSDDGWSRKRQGWNDENEALQYQPEQLAWRGGLYEIDDAALAAAARTGNLEAIAMMLGTWEAPPRKREPKERETKLDTAPQKRGRGRLRPVLTRFGRDVPTTMYWTPWYWENGDGTST